IKELSGQEDFTDATVPLMEVNPGYPLYTPLHIEESRNPIQDDLLCSNENGYGIWNELAPLFPNDRALPWPNKDDQTGNNSVSRKRERSSGQEIKRISDSSISKSLSREMISKYFYMPITQAAKELDVGLTLLKKRCREVGIKRWPHRKLMSLQTLIKNIQEWEQDEGEENEDKKREAIKVLEREKKMLEEMPDMQLRNDTKRLRQACFKKNYKKRKQMCLVDWPSSTSTPYSSISSASLDVACESGIEDEDFQFL
ncbi:hypothetical protein Tsubulata_013059, partial [Turnera subulata]